MRNVLGMTHSLCPECQALIPTKVICDESGVHFLKFCADHGETRDRIYSDARQYLQAQRFVKPAWQPLTHTGDNTKPCPEGCGTCDRHEQHLCMPIIEITQACDLSCPVCINSSGSGTSMTVADLQEILGGLLAAETQIDVLNFSGGEPLVHPRLLDLVDEALSREGIVRVSLSTNGLQLLEKPSLLDELHRRNVVISLQLDGFDDAVYETLRGRPLAAKKRAILALLKERQAPTSLTMTAAGGVNEHCFKEVLDCLFDNDHIISLMIQPIALTGRGRGIADRAGRLFVPDIINALDHCGHSAVHAADFVPLPCSHPLCFSLAFYLCLEGGGTVSMNRLTDAGTMMDSLSNRVVFGLDAAEQKHMKDLIYQLWSGPAGTVPDSEAVLQTLKGILRDLEVGCKCFDPRKAFSLTERKVKSIFIHAFQDEATFDLARVRRCCQAYPQTDGRLLPACVHNNLIRTRLQDQLL